MKCIMCMHWRRTLRRWVGVPIGVPHRHTLTPNCKLMTRSAFHHAWQARRFVACWSTKVLPFLFRLELCKAGAHVKNIPLSRQESFFVQYGLLMYELWWSPCVLNVDFIGNDFYRRRALRHSWLIMRHMSGVGGLTKA